MGYRSTKQVAGLLGITVARLSQAVWLERFTPPEKGPGGAYLWTDEDINRASWALCYKTYKPIEVEADGN